MHHYGQGQGGYGYGQVAFAQPYQQPHYPQHQPHYPQSPYQQPPQGYPPVHHPQMQQPAPKRSSSKAGIVIAVILLALFTVVGAVGAGVYVYLDSQNELAQFQAVPGIPGLKIPGGGVRNPASRADDVSYTYGVATESYTTDFVRALRDSVQSGGWRFERNKAFDDAVVFDCTPPTGKRVGALITKDAQGRILLTLM